MKNKTVTYLLIAVVLVVWGLVFYNIFSGLDGGYEPTFAIPDRRVPAQLAKEEEKILVMSSNYRDPFLGTTTKAIIHTEYTGNTSPNTHAAKSKTTDWSCISYLGIVNNKATKKKVALLLISGKEYMVNEEEMVNGVTILKRERDSVLVKYNGEKKWVVR